MCYSVEQYSEEHTQGWNRSMNTYQIKDSSPAFQGDELEHSQNAFPKVIKRCDAINRALLPVHAAAVTRAHMVSCVDHCIGSVLVWFPEAGIVTHTELIHSALLDRKI